METYRPLRGGLFIYECFRLLFLTGIFITFLPGTAGFPWLAYAAPGALFPLMALFVWLNPARYSRYLPLYIAGKCIVVFSTALWYIFSRHDIMAAVQAGGGLSYSGGVLGVLLGDLLSVAAGLLIIKKTGNGGD